MACGGTRKAQKENAGPTASRTLHTIARRKSINYVNTEIIVRK
jgi:hypothetical protein